MFRGDLSGNTHHPLPIGGGPNAGTPIPSELTPAAWACGEYQDWIEHETWHANREREEDQACRFGEHIDGRTAHLYSGEIERYWLQQEMPWRDGTYQEWQETLDCTLFARRFLRWVEAGCPVEKGRG